MHQVAVVGAGVIGLSTAVCVQQQCPGVKVTVHAKNFPPNTTSDVAGGLWEPHALGDSNSNLVRQLGTTTFNHLAKLATSSLAMETGVHFLSGYNLEIGSGEKNYEWISSVVHGYRELTQDELDMFPGAESGSFYTTIKVDSSTHLRWLMRQFVEKGGICHQEELKSLNQLCDKYDVIVNCCGIGARTLVPDAEMRPIKGQILKTKAPWMKHFVVHDNFTELKVKSTYFFPGVEYDVLGGTSGFDQWDARPDPETSTAIWERALAVIPQLKGAKVMGSVAGLRPFRQPGVRIDSEWVTQGKRKTKVVHNYGHGGAGWTLHWGSAQRATNLVAASLLPESLRENAKL